MNRRQLSRASEIDSAQASCLMDRKEFLADVLKLGSAAAVCGIAATAEGLAQQPKQQSLKSLVNRCGLQIGAQVEKIPLMEPAFAKIIKENFNLITPGNELKWTRLRPSPDRFNFADGDWMVNFARENGMLVQGTTLCWTAPYNPEWFKSVLTPQNAAQFLSEHITTVTKHYAGQIDSWIVVNEPVVTWSNRPDGFYPGIWLNMLGPQYIDIAFHAAAEGDPHALRVLNCYRIEQDSPGDEKTRHDVLVLVKQLLARRVPVQAVGIESHLDASLPLGGDKYARFLKEIQDLGLKVMITELDVNDTNIQADYQSRDQAVGKTYYDYLVLVNGAIDLKTIMFWTPSDKFNWMNSIRNPTFHRSDGQMHRSGMFDEAMNPKTGYGAVARALNGICH